MKQKIEDDTDTVMLLLTGFGIGSLFSATTFLFLGVFIEAEDNEIWSAEALSAGLMCVGISVFTGLITTLYWKYIASKSSVLFPELSGFKLIMAIISGIAGMMSTIGIAYKFMI